MVTTTELVPKADFGALSASITAGSSERKQLVCKDLLEGETLERAKAIAKSDYPKMLENSLIYAQYGNGALDGVNTLIDNLLDMVKLGESPEAAKIVRTLMKNLDGVSRKYDVTDPKVLAKYESGRAGILGFFGNTKSFWRMIMRDITSIETHIKSVEKRLLGNEEATAEIIAMYDQLYKENEKEISNLIFAIALMELIIDEALADIESIPLGDSSLGDRGGEQRAMRADLVNNLQIRIAEFKGRLITAWSTSPQVRTIRALQVSQMGKINSLFNIGVPTMKGYMVQIVILQRSQEISQANEAVAGAINAMIQQYANNVGITLPLIAQSVNTPTFAAQSVYMLAQGYKTATEGIALAIQAGAEERAKLDNAIVTTKAAMESDSAKLTDAIIEQAVSAAKPLQITTTVLGSDAAIAA